MTTSAQRESPGTVRAWLLEGLQRERRATGPHEEHPEKRHTWWQVMCLTGVDYFSTLGYQPGIAAVAAGALSPIATLLLVLLTLFGALPTYRAVAQHSPNGMGSIAMLEGLLPRWWGKLFVLVLLGFVATAFIFTITLSASDATAHILQNPFVPGFLSGHEVGITLLLIALLGGIFLRGFSEAIGLAVVLVVVYLALNVVVVGVALAKVVSHPELLDGWQHSLTADHSSPVAMIAMSLLVLPKLALGLSGFETGVAVMPQIEGDLRARIAGARRLLTTAALIMSVFLLASSVATTMLIPAGEFAEGGKASGRALAYLAHENLGDAFGTVYDVSTIAILWFAGASALTGLLNIVPRYLPRYGMAPDWARAVRPLVLVFTAIAFGITILFGAQVEPQGGAYATGVLVLILSAAIAVTLTVFRAGRTVAGAGFGLISLVIAYTAVENIRERPDGLSIAIGFVVAIVVSSLVSRATRSTELRVTEVRLDETARRIVAEAPGQLRLIANEPDARDTAEYAEKDRETREYHHLPEDEPMIFLEVTLGDASEFEADLLVKGETRHGYQVLTVQSPAVANTIAAILFHLRDVTGNRPHVYFHWAEGNPVGALLRYLVFGGGDVPPLTREVIRKAEPDIGRRPQVHVS
ncbi:amino acid transporter [Planotetraspora silvatica]|uniref:Amino acid transporter n=1 Tax=Planotetraspora silvatica TaxID=234614 RepID=A0A8J3XPS0_9ACTN|nr:amino acid transporter [Planotetraspora silvatica]GII48470.1 amino acid transporter [Planotetraspora silvatica]